MTSSPNEPGRRGRPGITIALSLITLAIAALVALQWSSAASDLSFSRHLLSNAEYRWAESRIPRYQLVVERRAALDSGASADAPCTYAIEVDGAEVRGGMSAADEPPCGGAPAPTVPELFDTIDRLLADGQGARSLSVRGAEDGQRPVVENVLSLPCGPTEASGYSVAIVYDQRAGYPHQIRSAPREKSAGERILASIGLLPRCQSGASLPPDLRVIELRPLP